MLMPKSTWDRARADTRSDFLAVVFLAIVLSVPYLVPQRPTASDSYLFGYNNRAGVILLVLLSGAFAIWKKGYALDLRPAGEPREVSRKALWICLGIQLSACLLMVLVAGSLGGFSESSYEIDRTWLLAHGKLPYSGFEWPFGVLLLYGPLWFARLLRCSIPGGYHVFWVLNSLAGVVLLFATINRLDYPTPRKTQIFVLFFIAFVPLVLCMGGHYTLVRYVAPLYFVLIVHRLSARSKLRKVQWPAASMAVVLTAVLLLISPEMAIAHALACCVLLFPRRSPLSPGSLSVVTYLAMFAMLAAVFETALKLRLFDTLRASAGGADSFPIPLSISVLFFFGVVFVCVCSLVRRCTDSSLNDNSVALIVLSAPLLAAALGRCDTGHIMCNGVGLILVVSVYASLSSRTWRRYSTAFVVAALAVPAYSVYRFSLPYVGSAAMRSAAEVARPGRTGALAKIVRTVIRAMPTGVSGMPSPLESKMLQLHSVPATIDFPALYPGVDFSRSDGILDAPFGYRPNGFGSYLSGRVDYGYFEGLENANTPAMVERKIEELAQHPERHLLIPHADASLCTLDGPSERQFLTIVFFFPYIANVAHPQGVREPLCNYIVSHYLVIRPATADDFEYELWSPKGKRQPGYMSAGTHAGAE
jgi:hypothetical protein